MSTQTLSYFVGAPKLRPTVARCVYSLFPDLKARLEEASAADLDVASGFTG